jgi:hypothetical protein
VPSAVTAPSATGSISTNREGASASVSPDLPVFRGWHEFAVLEAGEGSDLRHTLVIYSQRWARLTWPVLFRPLHDALLEDALDRAERSLGMEPAGAQWSPWVRALRKVLRRRRRP